MAANDYSWLDLMRACRAAGFAYNHGLVTAFAVSAGENTSRNLTAVFNNADQWHSRDRGPWQINDHWHPEVTDGQAFDLAQSSVAAYRISQSGTSFSSWSAFNNGRYQQFMDLGYAYYALDNALRTAADLQGQVTNLQQLVSSTQENLVETQSALDASQQLYHAEQATSAQLRSKIDAAVRDLT